MLPKETSDDVNRRPLIDTSPIIAVSPLIVVEPLTSRAIPDVTALLIDSDLFCVADVNDRFSLRDTSPLSNSAVEVIVVAVPVKFNVVLAPPIASVFAPVPVPILIPPVRPSPVPMLINPVCAVEPAILIGVIELRVPFAPIFIEPLVEVVPKLIAAPAPIGPPSKLRVSPA